MLVPLALPGTAEQDFGEGSNSGGLCEEERKEVLRPLHQASLIGPRPAKSQEKAATPLRCFHGNSRQLCSLGGVSGEEGGRAGEDGRGDEVGIG